MQMFLPKHDSAQPFSSSSKASVKRKHGFSSETGDSREESGALVQQSINPTPPVAVAAALSKSPMKVSVLHQPSEGLPTPLLSPTDAKMGPFQASGTQANQDTQDGCKARLRRTRQVIQQQINLEILLKHNELRLIDQELAKCQTAFEQLRRCKEIPFPSSEPSVAVSSGEGPSLKSSFSRRLPESPTPWGITDGPYARHYAQWLLPDTRFDGGEPETQAVYSGKRPTKSRPIRASFVDEPQVGMSSRSQRSGKLKALPAGYGQPKEKIQGPLILKRKSDGVMVKLICPVCSRGDFGSAQGFINHCRIGHGRNFSSHDQAAEQCGERVELDEHGAIVGQELTITPSTSFVHPLIRTARLNHSALSPGPTPRITNLTNVDGAVDTPSPARPLISPDFRASLHVPHLSDLIKNKGLGLNLQDIVTNAKVKVEFAESDDEEVEEVDAIPTPEEIKHRHPQVAGTRGVTKPTKSPSTSPLLQSRLPTTSHTALELVSPPGVRGTHANDDNGPSPTTESNQAPSLIDDDEDYEAHSPTSSSASEVADEEEVDFAVREDDDFNNQDELPQPESQPSCAQSGATHSPRPARVRRPSAFRTRDAAHEPKHVTFVSENPGVPKTGGDKKRRKVTKN